MARVQIEIRDSANSVVGVLDVGSDRNFPFTLTKKLASLNSLATTGGVFSKVFKIPATRSNNQLLEYLYSSNQRVIKNMKGKKNANVLVNGEIIERGYIKPQNIETKNGVKSYIFEFFGNNTKWITDLNDTELTDLTFNHNSQAFTQANIEESWIGTYSQGAKGNDHIYPWISYGLYQTSGQVEVEDMRPAIRYRAIIERSLNSVGFKLDSAFMDTANWKNLIFPFVGDKFKHLKAFVADKLFFSELGSAVQIVFSGAPEKLIFTNDSITPGFDTGSNFNTTTSEFTAPVRGKYRFSITLSISNASLSNNVGFFNVFFFKNGVEFNKVYQNSVAGQSILGSFTIEVGYWILESGDTIDVRFELFGNSAADIRMDSTNHFKLIDMSREILSPNTFNLSDVLPDINVLDLFRDITTLFNLYWQTDIRTKTVSVEDRDTFFNGISSAINWSDKLDIGKTYILNFISDYQKELLFSYATDTNDKYLAQKNIQHRFENNEWGSYKHVLPDRFKKGVQDIETGLIAASYPIQDFSATGAVTTAMWNKAEGSPTPPPSYDFNPRILNFQYDSQTLNSVALTWNWLGDDSATIPSALMTDVFGNSVPISLNFAESDGLVNDFYSRTLAIIEDGIQLSAWFKLTNNDYQTFDFKNPIYINSPEDVQGYWIVDTIHDFNPVNNAPTRVTLQKFHNTESSNPKITINTDWGLVILDPNVDDLPIEPDVPIGVGTGVDSAAEDLSSSEAPRETSIVINNNTGNESAKNAGNVVLGQGGKAPGHHQTVVGRFPAISSTDIYNVGAGTEQERLSAFRILENGDPQTYGGEMTVIVDGVEVPLLAEISGKTRKIYLKD